MEVIDWLNAHAGAITAIGTAAVAVATVVLVVITGYYAQVTRKMQLNA